MSANPSTQRELFSSRWGVTFALLGVSIGLGNVWRFPYMMGLYGGGAFLIIYLFVAAVFGVPALTAELALGRATRKGPLSAFTAAGVRNINGLTGGGGESGVTWIRPDPPPTDSTQTPVDSAGVVPDTLATVPDSIPPDTSRASVNPGGSPGRKVPFRGILPTQSLNRSP